jgi:hypothetical protein
LLEGGEKKKQERRREEGKEKKRQVDLLGTLAKRAHQDLLLGAKRTIYFLGTDLAESELYLGSSQIPIQCAIDRRFGRAG